MTSLHDFPLRNLQFFLTAPYPCSYLADREARSLVAAPTDLIDASAYSELVKMGFRRSGLYTYRPRCDHCNACVPVRIPVADFRPHRAQRRAWKRHEGLSTRLRELTFDPAHYELYRRYQADRHAGGGMDQDNREQYSQFLLQSNLTSVLAEFREADGALRMVSLIDIIHDGLSAVYTFFDPDTPHASFGAYGVLWQMELARQLRLDYLYLGYWIAQCPKMAYKIHYHPLQGLIDDRWQVLESFPQPAAAPDAGRP